MSNILAQTWRTPQATVNLTIHSDIPLPSGVVSEVAPVVECIVRFVDELARRIDDQPPF